MYDDLLKVEDRHIQLNKTLNDRLKIGHDRRKERNKIKKRKLNYKHKIK